MGVFDYTLQTELFTKLKLDKNLILRAFENVQIVFTFSYTGQVQASLGLQCKKFTILYLWVYLSILFKQNCSQKWSKSSKIIKLILGMFTNVKINQMFPHTGQVQASMVFRFTMFMDLFGYTSQTKLSPKVVEKINLSHTGCLG